jgi:hypothetical protein
VKKTEIIRRAVIVCGIIGLFCVGIFLYAQNDKISESREKVAIVESQIVNLQSSLTVGDRPYIPDSIEFFGGRVPLHIYGVWEDIDFWIKYYTSPKNRWRMLSYLEIAPRYFPFLDSTLVKEKIPRDAKYVSVAESELNPVAVSPAKAVGGWQFIRSTGMRNKLVINGAIDERKHFELATYAACKELKKLFSEFHGTFDPFESWMFSLGAYNAGSGAVWKAIKKDGESSYFLLVSLPKETERYIPRIIALKLIMENPDRYGFIKGVTFGGPDVRTERFTAVRFESWKALAKKFGVSAKELIRANAHITNGQGLQRGEYILRIPVRK